MINWAKKRKECIKCRGTGFVGGGRIPHERAISKTGHHGTVSLCECQPKTMDEIKEAAEQETLAAHGSRTPAQQNLAT